MFRLRILLLAIVLAGFAAGCGAGKKKEVTSLERKQAAALESEAQFALTIKDLARAEALFAEAASLAHDTGELWLRLGSTRMRLGNRDGAKAAYKNALNAFEAAAEEQKTEPEPWLQQVTALALLGRTDDARKLVERIAEKFPEHRTVRAYVDGKNLDRMLADPAFKELAL